MDLSAFQNTRIHLYIFIYPYQSVHIYLSIAIYVVSLYLSIYLSNYSYPPI